jgi:hypothetical protein
MVAGRQAGLLLPRFAAFCAKNTKLSQGHIEKPFGRVEQ